MLHEVSLHLEALRKARARKHHGDWLDVHREETLKQRIVQHSEQVEFEVAFDRGISIGRI